MQHYKRILLIILVVGSLLPAKVSAQSSNIRGKVKWITGSPAIGLEVKLQQNNRVIAITSTNERGLYAFFNINVPLQEFSVIVSDSYRILKEQQITGSGPNKKLPDITIE